MQILSQRGRLALAAVVDIASVRKGPVSQKALAARHLLPARHLEPLLQTLARAGILRGVRGPKGGYALARNRKDINCAEVVRAALDTSEGGDFGLLPPTLESVILPAMAEAERDYFERLEQISVADLCHRADVTHPPLLGGR